MKKLLIGLAALTMSTQAFAASNWYIDCSGRYGAHFSDPKHSVHVKLDNKIPVPALLRGKTNGELVHEGKTHQVYVTRYGNSVGIELIKIKTKNTGFVMGNGEFKLIDGNKFSIHLEDHKSNVNVWFGRCFIRAE